jgi:hypothetical protein
MIQIIVGIIGFLLGKNIKILISGKYTKGWRKHFIGIGLPILLSIILSYIFAIVYYRDSYLSISYFAGGYIGKFFLGVIVYIISFYLTNENTVKANNAKTNITQLKSTTDINGKQELKKENRINDEAMNIKVVVSKIILCAFAILENEKKYCESSGNVELLKTLTRATSLIDRISLVYSFLNEMSILLIKKEPIVLLVVDQLIKTKVVDDENKNLVVYRFDEKIEYFKSEIEVESQCSIFTPSAIINTLRNPTKPSTREITGINFMDAIEHWGIITETINKHFSKLLKTNITEQLI